MIHDVWKHEQYLTIVVVGADSAVSYGWDHDISNLTEEKLIIDIGTHNGKQIGTIACWGKIR